MSGMRWQNAQSGRGSGVPLLEHGVSGKAERVADSFCQPPCDEYRWPWRKNRGPAGGERTGERHCGPVFAEARGTCRARAVCRKIGAKLVRGNRREQEGGSAAPYLCIGDSFRRRTHGATSCGAFLLARSTRGRKGRRVVRSHRSWAEGRFRYFGIFL